MIVPERLRPPDGAFKFAHPILRAGVFRRRGDLNLKFGTCNHNKS